MEQRSEALTTEALALADAGDAVGSADLFRKASSLDPRNSQRHENLGVSLMRLGLLDEARAALNRAKRLRSGFPMGTYAMYTEEFEDGASMEIEAEASSCTEDASEYHLDQALEQPPAGVEVIWRRGDNTTPEIPGVTIYKPDQISNIVRYTVDPRRFADPADCGFTGFVAAFDLRGDLILGSIDNFFVEWIVKRLRNTALRGSWVWAHIDPYKGDPSNARKGNSFPGMRIPAAQSTTSLTAQCLKPALEMINPAFDMDSVTDSTKTLFGLLHPRPGPVRWLDKNRLPHTDVHEVNADGTVQACYASVLALTRDFNRSGTGLWVERSSGLSLLRTEDENHLAQGSMDPFNPNRRFPNLDLLAEVPNPPYSHTQHAWAEAIMVAELRYNRFSFYDARRLHQAYCDARDASRLTTDPAKGRLTMNSFFYGPAAGYG